MASRLEAAATIGRGGDDTVDVLKPLAVEDESSAMEISTLGGSATNSSLDRMNDIGMNNNNSNTNNNSNQMTLGIKSCFGDITVELPGTPKTTSVTKLKALVRQGLAKKEAESNGKPNDGFFDRRLRLICKGKLLSPDESLLEEFKVAHEDVVHAVLGKPGSQSPQSLTTTPQQSSQQSQSSRRGQRDRQAHPPGTFHHLMMQHQRRRRQRNRGTIVGPGGRVTRINNDSDHTDTSDEDLEAGRERRGFDRLRSAGLSRQEITAIRTYFNRHVDRYLQELQSQEPPPATLHLDEPDLSRRRLLVEEEWMQTQGPSSEFRLNLNQNTLVRYAFQASRMERPGSDRDFLWGFCLGFFVGILGMVWVWIPTISHKQKLGILTGICFRLLLENENGDYEENGMFENGELENSNKNAYDEYGN